MSILLPLLAWAAVVFIVAAACHARRPGLAIAFSAVVLCAIVFAPGAAFAAVAGYAAAAAHGIHPAIAAASFLALGIAAVPTPPDLTTLDAQPAEAPPIWASQSFWLAVLAFLAPIISAKLGVTLNTAEVAAEVSLVLGFVAKHAWTMHTTNVAQSKAIQAKADVLTAHVEAAASRDAGTAATALAAAKK